MNLAKFSVDRPVAISMMIVIVMLFGVISFATLSLDLLPDVEFPTVTVVTSYSGVSPEDIEEQVTKVIESGVATVQNVKSVNSVSQEGMSMVTIEFEDDANIDFAAQDIRSQLSVIQGYLPSDADTPIVFKMNMTDMPILVYGVTSETMDAAEIKKELEDNVVERLERLNGVGSVTVGGGQDREFLVKLNKAQMDAYGITQDAVVYALYYNNINSSGGFIEEGTKELSIRTVGEFKSLDEISNTVVGSVDGKFIYVKDLAEVVDTTAEKRMLSRTNNTEGVVIMVSKSSSGNTVEVSDSVKAEIVELEKSAAGNLSFGLVMDQSDMIISSTDSVKQSGLVGGLLAIVVLYIFLRNWRPTLAIGLAIPLSLIATFASIYIAGYNLNLMTLGGLALGIGMFIDNSVVVIENIYRHLNKTGKRQKSAIIGANEVSGAIIASTLTTISVFIPLTFATGITGQLTRSMVVTIAFSLLCSLFVSLTLVPMIASKIFKKKSETERLKLSRQERKMGKIMKKYSDILHWSLKNKKKVLLSTLAMFIVVVGIMFFIGGEFLPSSDQSLMLAKVKMPVGSSLDSISEVVGEVENVVIEKLGDNLETVTSIVGGSDSSSGSGMGNASNEAMLMIRLVDRKDRDISAEQSGEIIRDNLPPVRGLEFEIYDMTSMMISGSGNPIEIKVMGDNLETLKEIASEVSQKIAVVEGVRDVRSSMDEGKPELSVQVDRERASYFGLSTGEIGAAVRNAVQGQIATSYRDDGDEVNVRVRYAEEYRDNYENIENIIINTSLGQQIPLKQVAKIESVEGPLKIDREEQKRKVTITANAVDRDISSIVQDIKTELADTEIPDNYYIEYGGSYEQMVDVFGPLSYALILGILLVYMVMAVQFESLIFPFIVMFEIPLAFIGVGLALLLTNTTLSLTSFLGIIMVAGVVVNNAIVLIDYINQLRERGMDKIEAIIEGGQSRLRPILITSITTILGMFPMAVAQSEGSEFMRPMAVAVIGGLAVSTVLTLVVIPVIYSSMDKLSKRDFNRQRI